jgi:cell wall assembly regulator SMI1
VDNEWLFQKALQRLEQAWRDQGAPIVDALAPGATADQLDDVEGTLGFALPPEVRAWWGWHDGAVHPNGDGWTGDQTRIGPGFRDSLSSASALRERQARRDSWNSADPDADDGPDEDWDGLWRASWLPLLRADADLIFVDCKQTTPAGTVPIRNHAHVPEDVFTPASGSLFQAIEIWIWLLEERHVAWDHNQQGWEYENVPRPIQLSGLL